MIKNATPSTDSTVVPATLDRDASVKFNATRALTDCSQFTHQIRDDQFYPFRSNNDGSVTATYNNATNTVKLTISGTKFSSVRTKKEGAEDGNEAASADPLTGNRGGSSSCWKAVVESTSADGDKISGHFEP